MLDLIIGRRELGKTTLAVSLSRQFTTRVIFDPRHMIDTTSDVLSENNVQETLYEMLDSRVEVIVRPSFETERTFAVMCEEIYHWLKDNPDEDFCLLVDEARFVSSPEKKQHFDWIVRCTPRAKVSVLLTCHGVTDISPDLRRVADYWLLFRLTQPADLDTIREKCGDDVAELVESLNPYEYVVWNDAIGTYRVHRDPTKWKVDLKEAKNGRYQNQSGDGGRGSDPIGSSI